MTILSWLASCLTLASVYLIGKRRAYGHLVGLAGSLCWILYGKSNNDLALMTLNVVFVWLYLKNWLAWRKS